MESSRSQSQQQGQIQQNQQRPQQYYAQPQQMQVNPQVQPKHKGRSFFRKIINNKSLLVLIVVFQIVIIVLLLNPVAIIQNIQNQQVINDVASKTTVNTSESPVIATVTNADQLRKENAAQAEVYKDAQNGDYVLGYTDKMIIYRKSEARIIYEGDNPQALVTKAQEKVVSDITSKAKQQNLVPESSDEAPQISIITDVTALQESNSEFYSIARNNDIVALFPEAQLIVLYNQETETIVNSGKYTTSITTLE